MRMTTFANDWQKLGALGTLDVLEINNPTVRPATPAAAPDCLLLELNPSGRTLPLVGGASRGKGPKLST